MGTTGVGRRRGEEETEPDRAGAAFQQAEMGQDSASLAQARKRQHCRQPGHSGLAACLSLVYIRPRQDGEPEEGTGRTGRDGTTDRAATPGGTLRRPGCPLQPPTHATPAINTA